MIEIAMISKNGFFYNNFCDLRISSNRINEINFQSSKMTVHVKSTLLIREIF